jgi:ATP-dependent Clp protease ATP-binding subunit ClpC
MSSRSRIRRSGTSSSRSFDDGRLTERNGRTVDLRHCVIILTSNLGSAIPTGPGVGFVGRTGSFDASGVLKSVERSFRPELLNRLDRVVVFRPLGRGVMRDLLEKELTEVLRRRGFRMQPWAVEWDEATIDFLIEKGFTAELGARPLKRAIERHLLTRLAEAIVERTFPEGDQFLFITARPGAGLEVAFVDPDATDEPPGVAPPDGALTLAAVALDPHGSESEAVFLRAELDAVDNQAQHWRSVKAEALASMHEPGFWDSEARIGVLAQVEYLDRLEAATRTAKRLAGRLASRRETHSRELVELLSRRLLVLRGALRGARGRRAERRASHAATRPRRRRRRLCDVRRGAQRDVHELGRRTRDAGPQHRRARHAHTRGGRARRLHASARGNRPARPRDPGRRELLLPRDGCRQHRRPRSRLGEH